MLALLIALTVAARLTVATAAASVTLRMFPTPGSATASPQTQITLRGAPAAEIGDVVVTGSLSGVHQGKLVEHSDHSGVSFLPDQPFQPGELVLVTAGHQIERAGTSAEFTVAVPVAHQPVGFPTVQSVDGAHAVRSLPGVQIPTVKVQFPARDPRSGVLMLTSSLGPSGSGPFIADTKGNVLWFKPLPDGTSATNLTARVWHGHPVLTWWQGLIDSGQGFGEHVVADESYNEIARIKAGNGYQADLHEFQLESDTSALVESYSWIWWDLSAAGRPAIGPTVDCVIQQIDVTTGLVVFEWHSLDHVGVDESSIPVPQDPRAYDYFHLNSIERQPDGNLLISARHTSTVYLIDGRNGDVIWRLGGSKSTFEVAPDAHFSYQHSARRLTADSIALFDNGAAAIKDETYSSARVLKLDFTSKKATSVARLAHAPELSSNSQGDVQPMPGGGFVVGWGANPYVGQYDGAGTTTFDATFAPGVSYRAYRQGWNGRPATPPAAVAERSGGTVTVYVSWNGDTQTRTWQLLGGWSSRSVRTLARATKAGFETIIRLKTSASYFRLRAVDPRGRTLATTGLLTA